MQFLHYSGRIVDLAIGFMRGKIANTWRVDDGGTVGDRVVVIRVSVGFSYDAAFVATLSSF